MNNNIIDTDEGIINNKFSFNIIGDNIIVYYNNTKFITSIHNFIKFYLKDNNIDYKLIYNLLKKKIIYRIYHTYISISIPIKTLDSNISFEIPIKDFIVNNRKNNIKKELIYYKKKCKKLEEENNFLHKKYNNLIKNKNIL